MYSPKVMQNFANPQNVGEIPDADGVGTVGNPVCGDLMTIYIKVKDDKIADIKFKTFGCGAAIATSSMITQMAQGQNDRRSAENHPERRGQRAGGPAAPENALLQSGRGRTQGCHRRLPEEAGGEKVDGRKVAHRPPFHFLSHGLHFDRYRLAGRGGRRGFVEAVPVRARHHEGDGRR